MALDSALCDTGMCRTRCSKGKGIQVPRRGGTWYRRKIQSRETGGVQGGMDSKEHKPWFQVVLRDGCEGCKIPLFPVVQCDHTDSGMSEGNECATNREM